MADSERDNLGDNVLATLYSATTDNGVEIGVSLLVGGNWITGMLCSPRAWYEQVAYLVDTESDGGFGVVFQAIGRSIYPTEDEVEAGVANPPAPERIVGFIHLRDARTVAASGATPTDRGGLVRLRVDRIDGWMIGSLGEPGYMPPAPAV